MRELLGSLITLIFLSCAMPASAHSERHQTDLLAYLANHGFSAIPLTKLRSSHESVKVEINGVTGLFILDSGAGASVINNSSLAKFNLSNPAGPQQNATGAGGTFAINQYQVQSFAIESIRLPVTEVRSANLDGVVGALRAANNVEVDGVIGQDILTQFQGIIDVGGQRLFVRIPTR